MAKQYLKVDTSSPNYDLEYGTFFNKFDCFEEFVKSVESVAPGTLDYKIISQRLGQNPRREVLIECSFKESFYSNSKFYVYVCPLEGGGRFDYEQRVQFNPSSRWNPHLHKFEIAHKFLTSEQKSNLETYVLGIYKTSEKDDKIIFSGLYPSAIEITETDQTKTTTSSYQVRIESIQRAYQSGIDVEDTSIGTIVNFTPNNLFWYMLNRDNLHIGDLEQIAKLVDSRKNNSIAPQIKPLLDEPLQQIFFGAPGTGKSHRIKEMCMKYEHDRITFHPDTDYAAFVGSYKPITVEEPVFTYIGKEAHPVIDSSTGKQLTTKKITYNYVTQPFLNAYIKAWKEQQNEKPQPVFLVIEEINRGNCAQIFGDIFQLLDRNESGFSDYPITADSDLKNELAKSFKDLEVNDPDAINDIYKDDIVAKVKEGSHLLLPNNLYIWATMNTSDQSLFPIDSAFKRRWDWKYIKISKPDEVEYRIAVNGKEYDWWDFVQEINTRIGAEGTQEDKKLGYFFAKAKINAENRYIISADKFLSKVLFFLYNDVYKDFGYDADMFKGENGEPMQFADYFDQSGETIEVAVERFLQNLKLVPIADDSNQGPTNRFKAIIGDNSNPPVSLRKCMLKITEEALTLDPTLSFQQIQEAAKESDVNNLNKLFLLDSERSAWENGREDKVLEQRYHFDAPLTSGDGKKFYVYAQWGNPEEHKEAFSKYAEILKVPFSEKI